MWASTLPLPCVTTIESETNSRLWLGLFRRSRDKSTAQSQHESAQHNPCAATRNNWWQRWLYDGCPQSSRDRSRLHDTQLSLSFSLTHTHSHTGCVCVSSGGRGFGAPIRPAPLLQLLPFSHFYFHHDADKISSAQSLQKSGTAGTVPAAANEQNKNSSWQRPPARCHPSKWTAKKTRQYEHFLLFRQKKFAHHYGIRVGRSWLADPMNLNESIKINEIRPAECNFPRRSPNRLIWISKYAEPAQS